MPDVAATRSWSRTAAVTVVGIAAVAIVFAWLAWRRRWISDDGLIVVRTVRQILAGNGPVYNAFERAEPNTSTLWTWLVALHAWMTGGDVARVAVATGGILAVLGVILGMDATRRLHRARGSTAILAPAGVFVVLGVYPFWDFATSGLETGLCTFWIAAIWWLLVMLGPDSTRRRQLVVAIVFGLGPLVRPDFAIASAVFLVAGWLIVRPPLRRTVVLAAAAIMLPLAYEVFRAGYYGALVPLPALAKSASGSAWGQGFIYLRDYLHPYALWLPFGALAALLVVAIRRHAIPSRARIVVGAPVIAAVLMAAFVLRVGGDFMHARMFLAPTFMVVLPTLLLPVRWFTLPALVVIAGWALVTGIQVGDGESHCTGPSPMEDEHWGYVGWTGRRHPTDAKWFVLADRPASTTAADAIRDGTRLLIFEYGFSTPMSRDHAGPIVYAPGRLGTGGAVAPLDAIVADTLGLANPIGARITVTNPGQTGHEKPLPRAWTYADFAAVLPNHMPIDEGASVGLVDAARHAMRCGELRELLDSVRAPLTASRFWDNLGGAVRRTRLVIPSDPIEAELKFCGWTAVTASSSWERDFWSRTNLVDGIKTSEKESMGYASVSQPTNHVEWIVLHLPTKTKVSTVVLYPSANLGFPVDFQIQIWDGERWLDRVTRTGFPAPRTAPQSFSWDGPDTTDQIRIYSTQLVAPTYQLQLAEIEVS